MWCCVCKVVSIVESLQLIYAPSKVHVCTVRRGQRLVKGQVNETMGEFRNFGAQPKFYQFLANQKRFCLVALSTTSQ